MTDAPLAIAYGAGRDSTALLVGLWKRNIRPDLILFADVGTDNENPETYEFIPIFDRWLQGHGFPGITVVKYVPKRAPYRSLYGNCLKNETLPSLAFGFKGCSLKWKVDPQDRYCKTWQPAIDAWARGQKVRKAIGYDASPRDKKRCTYAKGKEEDPRYDYWYPLIEWGWTIERCKAEIKSVGLPVPHKSSCYFCPAATKPEIIELAETHPDLFAKCVALEHTARDGKHGLKTVKGLGRRFSWESVVADDNGGEAAA